MGDVPQIMRCSRNIAELLIKMVVNVTVDSKHWSVFAQELLVLMESTYRLA